MEGCHWAFRKSTRDQWPSLLQLLLSGRPVRAADAVGWLVDFAGPMDETLSTAWQLASGTHAGIAERTLETGVLDGIPAEVRDLPPAGSPATEAARRAIVETVKASCGATLSDAIGIQAAHSARFMVTDACKRGAVGSEYSRTMAV
jgi:enoyl-CoA hydratase/carnithine racemase